MSKHKISMSNDDISEVWHSMSGGPAGWLKEFGYLQFARAIEDWIHARHGLPDVADKIDAGRYRFLRNPSREEEVYPQDGSCWVVQYHHPKGMTPELRSAGFGSKLDSSIDLEISKEKQNES